MSSKPTTSKNNALSHLAKQYQKKTDREHILDAPDTYIGSIEQDETMNWIWNDEQNKMELRSYNWIPGLYKIFDEGVVNSRDHFVRMNQKIDDEGKHVDLSPVTNINIDISKETGVIKIYNDGNGIDVEKHPEHDLWIPEMIFGHLRTSTNYNKEEKKIVGGKNGFGVKLIFIYSKWATVETIDHIRHLKYTQRFEDNLNIIEKPHITKCSKKPYTSIEFLPDYKRFGIDNLTDDMYQLLKKRVFDIGAVTDKSVKVRFNGEICPIRSFENYIDLYLGNKKETQRIYELSNERWEYAVALSPIDEFTQVSFVNGIYTSKGGKHVDYVLNQIIKKLVDYIEAKKKVKVKPATIKEQLMLFVNAVIENPAFDSQTKDYMNTASAKFGSSCKVSDKFIEKLAKMGVMNTALSLNQVKETNEAKKTDGKKTRNIIGIPKLSDANYAGTPKSSECTLILCEGDSAKAGVISGLQEKDRNYYGVYPLKGKLLNVKDETSAKIAENKEICEIKKILGLETNQNYKTKDEIKSKLRYGKVMILTDQDLDGSHIKGLVINLFQSHWHNLIEVNDFLTFMNTPILKAKKGKQTIKFYNEGEYDEWKKVKKDELSKWSIKYYKGLGTSKGTEFREYFQDKKMVCLEYKGKESDDAIDLVFSKNKIEERKDWLSNYDKNARLNIDDTKITYNDFIHKEMIHFSKYDCERSIPNMVDGLKTSQRKILYSAFKRNLTKEIKVAQFAGYVSEHSLYHHGEMSLNNAIVSMAQNFVGSNNINLLKPNGQFGTRLAGGKDSASTRYIFTQLNEITTAIFRNEDLPILNYLEDDGTQVEPEFYMPIIPMILVNGTNGIGTGFSSQVLNYNIKDIIEYIRCQMKQEQTNETNETPHQSNQIHPYYLGFKGDIINQNDGKYLIKGKYEKVGKDTVRITELPVGTWTDKYKEFIEKQIVGTKKETKGKKETKSKKQTDTIIKEYTDLNTELNVNFTLKFQTGKIEELENKKTKDPNVNGLEEFLNLTTSKSTNNMHLFDEEQKLKKYKNVCDILDEFIPIRLSYYQKRKDYILKELKHIVMVLQNKARFIKEQCDDIIDLRRKKSEVIDAMLDERKYDRVEGSFKYLRKMPTDSVSEEEIEKLMKQKEEKEIEYETLKNMTIQTMWLNELENLEKQYEKFVKSILL